MVDFRIIVNLKNKWTCANNSDLHAVSKSPPDKGDLGGWLYIGHVSLILRSTIIRHAKPVRLETAPTGLD